MEKIQKFGRNSRRFIKRLSDRGAEKQDDENLNFCTKIHKEERSIIWKIENFDRCPLKLGEYHQSPQFCTGYSSDTVWTLRIYPKGKTNSGKVGFYLCKVSPNTNVSVEFQLDVAVPAIDNVFRVLEKKISRMDSDELGADVNIPSAEFLRQQSVKMVCTLTVGYLDEIDDGSCSGGSSPICTLSSDLKKLFSNGKFSDITLNCGKKHFAVHKAILAARSNVFAAMFDHSMEESQTSVVNVDDVEAPVMSDFLQFLYTNAVDDLTINKAIALFKVADKYSVEELRKLCVRVMLAKLSVENVFQIAMLADMHSEPKLKSAANHVFRKYKRQVFEKKEWETLISTRPQLASEILRTVTTDLNTSF